MQTHNYLLKQELTYDMKLVPDTALYIANIIQKFGINSKKSLMLCFALETALEERITQLSEQNPYLIIEVLDNVSEIQVSLTDKGIPYI